METTTAGISMTAASNPISWPGRLAIWLVLTLLMAVVCPMITGAGLVSEELAEMNHGGLSMLLCLWAFGALKL